MSLLSIEEVKTLVEQPKGLFVSIYMPIYRLAADIQQNPTRLKNLIRQAESTLLEAGLSAQEAGEFLQPIQELVDSDESFWQENNNDGLAIFLTSEVCRHYRLPLSFQELFVAVGVQKWGIFNPGVSTATVDIHSDAELGDEDLLDAAATHTLLNGGTVYAVELEKVPDEALLAAVFRY